jgi:hypothetical protein
MYRLQSARDTRAATVRDSEFEGENLWLQDGDQRRRKCTERTNRRR